MFRFGKMNTVARFVIGEFGVLDFVTLVIIVASYCSGSSIIRLGRFFCVRRVVSRIFFTSLFVLEVSVE